MNTINQRGISVLSILIIVILFAGLGAGSFVMVNTERAKTRDAKRIADMARLQSAFEILFNDTASYEQAARGGCDQKGALVSQCNLGQYIPAITEFKDPGRYSYQVTGVPSLTDYQITFTLEKGVEGFVAGRHTLSAKGIK